MVLLVDVIYGLNVDTSFIDNIYSDIIYGLL